MARSKVKVAETKRTTLLSTGTRTMTRRTRRTGRSARRCGSPLLLVSASKALLTTVLMTSSIYLGSSIWSPGVQDGMQYFGVGPVPAALGITLFVFGYGIGPLFLSVSATLALLTQAHHRDPSDRPHQAVHHHSCHLCHSPGADSVGDQLCRLLRLALSRWLYRVASSCDWG